MAWHMWAPSSVGPAFYPSADKLGRVRWELPTKLSHPCPAVMAMAKLWPYTLWSSTKAQWDPIIFVAAGAALVQGGRGQGCQFRGKWKIRFSCTSCLLLQQHQWRTLVCVQRENPSLTPCTGSRDIQLCCPIKGPQW